MYRTHRENAAFTLVEILVVVVILGLISAVIIPQLGSRGDLIASAAARQVMSDIGYAQNRAITTQSPVYMVFTPGTASTSGQYSVFSALPATMMIHPIDRKPWTVSFGGGRGAWAAVRIDTADFDGSVALMFDESGAPMMTTPSGGSSSPLNAGSVRISCNGEALTIRVEPLTGTLTVQ